MYYIDSSLSVKANFNSTKVRLKLKLVESEKRFLKFQFH